MSFYNAGRDGNSQLYNYAIFNAILKRHTPKIIIIDINYDDLYYDRTNYERLSSLLPYYWKYPEIRDIVNLKAPLEKFKVLSSIYPYNSSLITIAIGNLKLNQRRKSDRKGYIPLSNVMKDSTLLELRSSNDILDSNIINSLKEIISACKHKNINLIFVQSPIYAKIISTKSNNCIEQLTNRSNTPFWSFFNDSTCTKQCYFQDFSHMNESGAIHFSRIITERIDKLITR